MLSLFKHTQAEREKEAERVSMLKLFHSCRKWKMCNMQFFPVIHLYLAPGIKSKDLDIQIKCRQNETLQVQGAGFRAIYLQKCETPEKKTHVWNKAFKSGPLPQNVLP